MYAIIRQSAHWRSPSKLLGQRNYRKMQKIKKRIIVNIMQKIAKFYNKKIHIFYKDKKKKLFINVAF